ncbi:uncharacterized protein V6R79_012906 [Siganus canaliculatus]
MDAAKSAISCLHVRAAAATAAGAVGRHPDTRTHWTKYSHLRLCHEQRLLSGKAKSFVHNQPVVFNSHCGPKESSVQLLSPRQEMEEVLL